MRKLKIGQIGVCHEHAGAKMRTLRMLSDVFEVVGVVDDRGSTAARFAGADISPYEGLRWMTEEELFNVTGLDAVMIETPNLDLVPTALRCLERGLPIHMDKPGGDDLAVFKRLRHDYEQRGIPFQMGYMFRVNPAMRWISRAVKSGRLGEIFEIRADMSHNYGGDAYQEYLGRFSGGVMFNLGCHLIDFVVELLGRPASVSSFLKSAPGGAEHIANNCLSILEYPRSLVTLHASSREVGGLERRRLKVCGIKGTVELSPLERFDGEPLTMDASLSEDCGELEAGRRTLGFGVQRDRYEEQLRSFAQMVRSGEPDRYTAAHDCLVQEAVLAAIG